MSTTENRWGARGGVPLLVFVIVALAVAQTGVPKPRASSAQYPAHAAANGVSIGATVAAPYGDLVVIEVSVYPPPTVPMTVSPDDFALRINDGELVIKPSEPPGLPRDRKLAKARITQPTAGYLYFSVPIPKEKRASAELEYYGAPKILRITLPAI
jgi:hypothetical protein